MSRRTNGTNRAAAAINVSRFNGKTMPGKRTSLAAATAQAHKDYKISMPLF